VHEQVRGDVGATQRRRTPVPEGGRLVRDGQSGVIPAPPAELIQWAQVLAPIIAAFAAVASWRSAKASLRTAGRADDTARRSAEALSRSTRPDFTGMLAQTDERTTAPQPMTLYLLNRTPHRGRILSARVETPDGTVLGESKAVSIEVGDPIGSPNGQVHVPMGMVRRARPNVSRGDTSPPGYGADLRWIVEYVDAASLARWRQRGRGGESVRFDEDGDDRPIYLYSDSGAIEEPELVEPVEAPPVRRKRWWRVGSG
jgi:hypothetical protein